MYKIDFEIKTILPWETPNSIMVDFKIEELYEKLSSATSSYVINGMLKLSLVRTDELSILLKGFGFCINMKDFTEAHRKLEEILYDEFSYLDENLQIHTMYDKVSKSNPFHFLFVMLKIKIRLAFSSLKRKFLSWQN